MEERLTHGGAGGEARGADHAQGVPARWAPPILLVETSLPVRMSLTVPHVSGPGCPPKRPRYPALGSMRRLAGLLALSTGPEWMTMYYERREVGRFPTLAEFRHTLFILATSR